MSIALSVDNIGKAYRQYVTELQRVATWFGWQPRAREERWVLRNISFSLTEGECLGIIGHNGAGKSTLLKLIAGTLRPSEGAIGIAGDISAILELGMGFNAELTGRANAIHASGLMGRSQGVIANSLVQIEEFAEIGDFFDRPLRTYSSGMQARLAFAVATAVRPQVLIVDEALSVGDAYFQHKSFARIKAFREAGTSLLFVSHDRGAIQSICDRALLLDQGLLIKDGYPDEVCDYYNAIIAERENSTVRQRLTSNGKVQTISGSGEASIEEIVLANEDDEIIELVNVGQFVDMRVTAAIHVDIPRLVLGYMIKDRLGQVMYGTNTHHTEQVVLDLKAHDRAVFHIRFPMNLGPGTYSVSTALVSTDTHFVNNYEWRDLALVFTVANLDRTHFAGTAWIEPAIAIVR